MPELDGRSDGVFVIRAHSRPGVLARIASQFHRRALDIRSLTAGTTGEAGMATIAVRVAGDRQTLARIAAALRNLVDVLSVDLSEIGDSMRELCMVRVDIAGAERAAVLAVAARCGAAAIEEDERSLVLGLAAPPAAVEQFLAALGAAPLLAVSRSGLMPLPP